MSVFRSVYFFQRAVMSVPRLGPLVIVNVPPLSFTRPLRRGVGGIKTRAVVPDAHLKPLVPFAETDVNAGRPAVLGKEHAISPLSHAPP